MYNLKCIKNIIFLENPVFKKVMWKKCNALYIYV